MEKFYNEAVIGNKKMLATYSKKGELLRLFYPNVDFRQFIDYFHIGLKINDSQIIYLHEDINNVLICRYDIDRILNVFDENDKIDRIYINFCNPWPRGKHHKKRLTHTRQLEKYKQFLVDGGKIYFKTDDDNLFTESLLYFKEAGFEIEKVTYDLANEQDFWNGDRNIETEHEKMFKEQGIKIKALIARK